MHLQVRCFTCGVVLGHVAKIYREELMRKINAIRVIRISPLPRFLLILLLRSILPNSSINYKLSLTAVKRSHFRYEPSRLHVNLTKLINR